MTADQTLARPAEGSGVDIPLITGVHHTAFRCRDAAETRHFYQEILGLPLAAALAFDKEPGTNAPLKYMHLFFELGDGNYVAFFDLPESATAEKFKKKSGFNLHIAFSVDNLDDLNAFKDRLEEHGIECYGPLDHHFVQSIYCYDPNGIQVEVTCRVAAHDSVMAAEAAKADAEMKQWTTETMPIKSDKLGLSSAAE